MVDPDPSSPPTNRFLLLALAGAALPTLGSVCSILWPTALGAVLLETVWRAVLGVGPLAAAVVLSAWWRGRRVLPHQVVWRRLWFPTMGAMLAVLAGLQMYVVPGLGMALLAVLFLDPVALAEARQPVVRAPTGIPLGLLGIWVGWSIWTVALADALGVWIGTTESMSGFMVRVLIDLGQFGLLFGWCLKMR